MIPNWYAFHIIIFFYKKGNIFNYLKAPSGHVQPKLGSHSTSPQEVFILVKLAF